MSESIPMKYGRSVEINKEDEDNLKDIYWFIKGMVYRAGDKFDSFGEVHLKTIKKLLQRSILE